MSKILVVTGTVNEEKNSYSTAVVKKFIDEYKKINKDDEFTFLNLNNTPMANITLNSNNFSNYFNKEDALDYIAQLKSVDKLIISSPMNNFGPSSLIKNYLDHVLLADQTFSYKYGEKGKSIGLLTNLTVQPIVAQGAPIGWYPFGSVENYLKGVFDFTGSKQMPPIVLAGTKVAPLKDLSPEKAAETLLSLIQTNAKKF